MADRIELTSEQALANARANPRRQWSLGGESVKARFDSCERMTVGLVPKFRLSPDERVYTIGSCFAREIERTLIEHGIPLLTNGFGLPPQRFDTWNAERQTGGGVPVGKVSRGCFNKYTTHSMNIEVQRALAGLKLPNDGLIEFGPDEYFDAHAAGLRVSDLESARGDRAHLDEAAATLANADVVFVTLGMTESWVEIATGIPMNRAPTGSYLMKKQGLFRFVDYGYSDVHAQVVEMLKTLRTNRPNVKVIMTVSPVPHSTFREQDALVTVTGAKSTLRAVAEAMYREYDWVDYFPSYEMVINSPRSLAWLDDGVHVQPSMVRHVTQAFIRAYYE